MVQGGPSANYGVFRIRPESSVDASAGGQTGSEAKCREAGKQAIEGRDYVVRDGDVMHFRFNV